MSFSPFVLSQLDALLKTIEHCMFTKIESHEELSLFFNLLVVTYNGSTITISEFLLLDLFILIKKMDTFKTQDLKIKSETFERIVDNMEEVSEFKKCLFLAGDKNTSTTANIAHYSSLDNPMSEMNEQSSLTVSNKAINARRLDKVMRSPNLRAEFLKNYKATFPQDHSFSSGKACDGVTPDQSVNKLLSILYSAVSIERSKVSSYMYWRENTIALVLSGIGLILSIVSLYRTA